MSITFQKMFCWLEVTDKTLQTWEDGRDYHTKVVKVNIGTKPLKGALHM